MFNKPVRTPFLIVDTNALSHPAGGGFWSTCSF